MERSKFLPAKKNSMLKLPWNPASLPRYRTTTTDLVVVSLRNTYRTADEANLDKAQLAELREALNAWPSALRRDESGIWILRGRPGCYVATWGDGKSWHIVVAPEEVISVRQWTAHKKRLGFAELTLDDDQEGCFRLHRLPTAEEAEVIRDIVGIRKRRELSPEELARITERLRPRRGYPYAPGLRKRM